MFFEKLDCFLVDWFERQSHRFQRLTGKDCFWLAELCVYVFVALWLGFAEFEILTSHPDLSLIMIGGLLVFIIAASFLGLLQYNKKSFKKNPQFKNGARCQRSDRITRVFWLFIFSFNFVGYIAGLDTTTFDYILLAATVLIAAVLYLIACTPLPPGTSMFRKLVNKVRAALTVSPQVVPDPAPS